MDVLVKPGVFKLWMVLSNLAFSTYVWFSEPWGFQHMNDFVKPRVFNLWMV